MGTLPQFSPSPVGRSREMAASLAAFDRNNTNRAATFGDYRGEQIGSVNNFVDNLGPMAKVVGGMQAGALVERQINSGLLGKGNPGVAPGGLTGAGTAALDAGRLSKGKGSGKSGFKPTVIMRREDGSLIQLSAKEAETRIKVAPTFGKLVNDSEIGADEVIVDGMNGGFVTREAPAIVTSTGSGGNPAASVAATVTDSDGNRYSFSGTQSELDEHINNGFTVD